MLGTHQKHVLRYAAKAAPQPVWPQDRRQEAVADRLTEKGLLRLDEPKQKYKTPCYHITDAGVSALSGLARR